MPKNNHYTTIANKYCEDVLSGVIPACKYVKLACKRHLDDIEKSKDASYPYEFDEKLANRRCAFSEKMFHVKGKWAGKKIILEPHQVFFECAVWGWVKKKNRKRRFNLAMLLIPRKNGKALEINTPILTTNGWKKHGELKIGDYVFNGNGNPVKVIGVTDQYIGDCYELKFSDGDRIISHSKHEWDTDRTWYTKRKKSSRGEPLPLVETEEIFATLKFDSVSRPDFVHRIKITKPIKTDNVDLPIDAYMLGVWLGDGSSNCGQITINDEDFEIIDRIKKAGYSVNFGYKKGKSTLFRITTGSRKQIDRDNCFAAYLRKIGVHGNKHIPEIYLRAGLEQRYELLRGLLDTDGTVSKRGQISLTLTNKKLIEDALELIRSLGIKACIKEDRAILNGKDCGAAYHIHFYPADNTPLFYAKRKGCRVKEVPNKKNRRSSKTVCGAEFVGNHLVNCISVEGGFYLAGKGLTKTHNSIIAAISGLYGLVADNEKGSECYSGANTEKQALEVFRPAWQMVKNNPQLASHFNIALSGTPKNPTSIYRISDMSRFELVVGTPGDGASPHYAIVDEFHEASNSSQFDTFSTGMGAREQPLLLVVTTAGTDTSTPCYELYLRAIKVLEGTIEDDSFFALMYGIDQEDKWDNFDSWKKANPNYLISIEEDYLKRKFKETLTDVSKQNINLTKHLNVWTNAGTAWMNMTKWAMCSNPSMQLSDFSGVPCYAGLDLASKIDICALVLLFEIDQEKMKNYDKIMQIYNNLDKKVPFFAVFCKYYLPEETVKLAGNDHYVKWVKEGYITETPGARTDFLYIEDDLKAINQTNPIIELAYDPREATYLINNVSTWLGSQFVDGKEVSRCIEITQGAALMSEPMKELEAMVYAQSIWHNGDPVLTWMMGNVVRKQGRNSGTVKYYYPTKEKNEFKIDAPVATIMAVSRVMGKKIEDSPFDNMSKEDIVKRLGL